MSAPSRIVHEQDAVDWLRHNPLPEHSAIVTSLPNFDEFGHRDPARWRPWFVQTAEQVLRSVPAASAAVFFQTDVEVDGVWLDKAFLLQQAAEATGSVLLWHKVVLRAPPGTTCHRRPGWAHLLCFSRELRRTPDGAAPDVLERAGERHWPRGMGDEVATFAVRWLREHAAARTIVAPFCGVGTALLAANRAGLDAIGIERNPGRAARARALGVTA